VIFALTTQLIAEDVVRVIFGDAYLAAAPVLALHVWAGVFVFTRALISRWLIAEDLIRISLWSHGAGALANVLLNLWLIPPYGAQGAAIATLVSYGVAGWVAFVIPRSTRVVAMQIARAAALPFRWRDLAGYWNDMTRKR
jgi:PST family polysaccharide transporter